MSELKKLDLAAAGAVGIVSSVVLTLLLCLPGAALIGRGVLPMDAAVVWSAVSAGVAVFIAVLVLALARRRQAMPTAGVVAGGAVLLAALACLMGGGAFGAWLWRLAAAVLIGGAAGAFMSIRRNPHKKRRR